ncbi:GAF domain-containing protein [Piscinibacter sakaiensis]|uniref:Sensory box histidine kinase/response regulator n=1 Tax=Piscinibacter sakaiensis TaxID=1547922 RepID=A0A0K8NXP6_PISS1|nr:GAF domain-containing protein [Piscinibacter sakaiensis]GAP35162.1 sensory box histidine kinase/response regulator [Piscinibacter sakaiensis]
MNPAAPLPADEALRLVRLHGLGLLEGPDEPMLDAFVASAAAVTGYPVAALSLVDAQRVVFRSRQGFVATECPRSIAFCGHTILGAGVHEVPDAAADPRYADAPMLQALPPLRAYAGVAVRLDGAPVGALCVMDTNPRHLAPHDREALLALARGVDCWLAQRQRAVDTGLLTDEALRRPARPVEVSCNGHGGFHLALRMH